MSLLSIVVLMASVAGSASDAQKPDLFPTGLSFAAPATFETCKKIDPAQAATYDLSLKAWQDRNYQAIEQLIPVLSKQIEADGRSTLEQLKAYAASAVADFNGMPPGKQIIGCRDMLSYITSN